MATKPEEVGKLGLAVKMDYSETYRENEKLDLDLDQHLDKIVLSEHRFLTEKEEELELAKLEAERSLKWKEAAKKSQESGDGFGFVTIAVLARCRSSLTPSRSLNGEEDSDDVVVIRAQAKPSLTERRIATERDMYSAKRMFNVVRKHNMANMIESGNKSESSVDSLRKAVSVMTMSKQAINGRPHTEQAGGRHAGSAHRNRGYLRPTTATASRLSRLTYETASSGEVDGYGRPSRRARSRLELEKLCRLNIDPFEDVTRKPEGWAPSSDPKQNMLKAMRAHSGQIQTRVSAFIKELEDFNKRDRKSRLDHILETAR